MRQEKLLLDAPDVVRTAVSPDYVSGWGMVHALREIIQEMLDARRKFGCRGGLRYSQGRAVVWDDGPGLKKSDLALGRSGKRDDDRLIGQFGEGIKLACLVAARNGREMKIETVGFTAVPFIARDPALGCDVLAFSLTANSRERGTAVTVEASPEEFAAARDMFLWGQAKRPRAFLPGGRVYVNGCLAQERPDLILSYDLSGSAKLLQNRDRTVLDESSLRQEVARVLSSLSDPRLIRALLESVWGDWRFEHSVSFRPDARVAGRWRRAAREVFGPKACLSDGSAADREAERLGFSLVARYPWLWSYMLEDCGILLSSRAVAERSRRRQRAVRLSPEEKKLLSWAKRVVRRHLGDPGRVKVAEELSFACGRASAEALGLWDPAAQVIWLRRDLFRDRRVLLGVLFHEALHRASGAADCTAEFERAWQQLVVDMALRRSKSGG